MYRASEDYPRLKELLDKGEKIVCYIDFSFRGKEWVCRDIAQARRQEDPLQYSIGVRGHGYCSVFPDWFEDYSEENLYKLWENLHVQFIDPDPSRNNVELKTESR